MSTIFSLEGVPCLLQLLPIFHNSSVANFLSITAELETRKSDAEAVIVAQGGSSGDFALFVNDEYVFYVYNFFSMEDYVIEPRIKMAAGKVTVCMNYDQAMKCRPFLDTFGGKAELFINGNSVGGDEIPNQVTGRFSITETLDVGTDLGASVSSIYRPYEPYEFTGHIDSVKYKLAEDRPVITANN